MNATVLDALENALKAERDALSGSDVEPLLLSTEAKLAALRAAETAPLGAQDAPRVQALAQYNRENGLMLARRRRAVAFALRQLGRAEPTGYTQRGQRSVAGCTRPIAVA